jgi:RimJ/RimL family protein N-acetyltransferase
VPFTPQSEELVRSRIEHEYAARDLAAEGDVVILAIEVASTGTVVGDVMLRLASAAHRTGELGYVVNPAHGGHGYATEAAHTLLHLAFDELGWHRVVARVDARNTASADVARRLGMRQEAHHVENEWFKGEWSDELTFALLDREWRSQHDDPLPWCPPGIP